MMNLNEWMKSATPEERVAFKLGRGKQKHVTRVASRNHDVLAEACRAIAAHFPMHPAGKIALKAIEKCKPIPEPTEWR
jgi:hypothetical protein